ncbi:MAG: NADPH-dependent assimilatory sulfite reductase hemoprotein subunit [Planctomycetaceae bacterium]|nr:NADPH-dependent assimilatory sulfite reductase hemoprotein subunit [Planctomycetaceae bacterium]
MSTAEELKLSKVEVLKEGSRQLRGSIVEDLCNGTDHVSEDSANLLKHHGTYQQDDRDDRKAKNADGTKKGKSYMFMVRTRVPGGRITAPQLLAHLDLCDNYGNGTIRITTRQGLQLHGVLKENLKASIRGINHVFLTTLAACGDVERNICACPAPIRNNPVRDEMQSLAYRLAEHLKPRSTAYYEIWLKDDEGNQTNVAEFQPVEEPMYGKLYLPRKFKTAIALPDDNCIDIYSNDLGFLAIVEDDKIVGYNVLVGGGMGRTPSAEKTFPALAQKLTFVTPDQVPDIAVAIIKVQRDHGNRVDRKVARMKYLIHNWGLAKFKETVEQYYGQPLPEPHPADVYGVDDHMGWHEQGDGKLFLGVNIENGRIKDEGNLRIKTAIRAVLGKYGMECRLTALQGLILCDIDPADRNDIEQMLREHGIKLAEELTPVRRYAIACPAFPTCGLSITESERVMPELIDQVEIELARHGLLHERISMHMTGCPNGCARPYTPDIGFVGKAVGKYTIFLGGNAEGTRLGFIYKDMIPLEQVVPVLAPLFGSFKADRQPGESFGDYCCRVGVEGLNAIADAVLAKESL